MLLNTWASFTHGSDKLNIGLLWLFSLKVSHAESKMDVVIPLSWTELWSILHFKTLLHFAYSGAISNGLATWLAI